MKVLFNADDFGLTKGITDGIVDAHVNGVVHSTSLMMTGSAKNYALKIIEQHPTLKVGIHLVLSWGKPLLNDVDSLVDQTGHFKFTSVMGNHIPNAIEVKREWQAQIEAYLKTGLQLNHLNSHHHVHGWGPLKEIVLELAKEYNVPVRYVDTLKDHPEFLLTDVCWTGFYADGVHEHIFDDIKKLDVTSVEVMTHPAYVDDALKKVSSYVEKRKEELDILTNLTVPDWVEIIS